MHKYNQEWAGKSLCKHKYNPQWAGNSTWAHQSIQEEDRCIISQDSQIQLRVSRKDHMGSPEKKGRSQITGFSSQPVNQGGKKYKK